MNRVCVALAAMVLANGAVMAADGNRFAYLDGGTPYFPSRHFPKLVTPQWVGEPGVEAVVVLAIDDLHNPKKYETFLRPILQRLKQIDGRAGMSIMTCSVKPDDPQLKSWLDEGVSLEVHTIDHPCPLLKDGNFAKARATYERCVDLLGKIPGNAPVAFRMPCCDSLNTVSPRFFAEIFNKTTSADRFLQIDSSVFNLPADDDEPGPLPRGSLPRFGKYVPRDRDFINLIDGYPYPYVIDCLCWEFPCVVPSDWSAQHFHKPNNPQTVADWKRALDLTVRAQGVMNLVFHPHGWIKNSQIVELIDHAVRTHGRKVKFLSFREALDRINRNLLDGNPLRDAVGHDNGVRILDVNNDGYMDVVIGNFKTRLTRVWSPKTQSWLTSGFPLLFNLTALDRETKFAVFAERTLGPASVVGFDEEAIPSSQWRGWDFNGRQWIPAKWSDSLSRLIGSLGGTASWSNLPFRRPALRLALRDLDGDGCCEAIADDGRRSAVYALGGRSAAPAWRIVGFALPPGTSMMAGSESGLRFEDVDGDGCLDVLFSNAERCSLHLFDSIQTGWRRRVFAEQRDARRADQQLPIIARADGTNNGAWFSNGTLWVQNEDTAKRKNLVESRPPDALLKQTFVGPLSPQESLREIRVHPGFTVELVAAEPLIVNPVAFEWGADGKLWIVEMVDYPLGVDGKGRPGGTVVVLEDTNGDGRYDKATTFATGLNLPNGILPWGKGAIVTAAPDILYLSDENGDGVADKREVLYTGFRQGNPQHRVNGLIRGLDGWIYCANGDSGGTITSTKTGKRLGIGGRDIRIRPQTGEIETEFGSTQFLRSRDDWGDWFGNSNSNPLWQYVLEERYARRNPLSFAVNPRRNVSVTPGASRCYPISRTERRFNDFAMSEHFTSACSAILYRDELFGPEFEGNSLVSEPVHNLVHREVLSREGIVFTSRRADEEQRSEFLASRDNWFRPTMIKVGPDGALYVADMYRQVIEHPEYIPAGIQRQLNFRAGADRGRLYRVFPRGKTLRRCPKLVERHTPALVSALDSRNVWQRDTAQQLLIERHDPAAAPLLASLAKEGGLPQGRLHALWTLAGLESLKPEVVLAAVSDPHWGVRKNAIQLAERFLPVSPKLAAAVLHCVDDPDPAVQLQAAYTLGMLHDVQAAEALGRFALRYADDHFFTAAVLSSLDKKTLAPVIAQVFAHPDLPELLTRRLLNAAVLLGDDRSLAAAISIALREEAFRADPAAVFARLAELAQSLDRLGKSLDRLQSEGGPELRHALGRLDAVLAIARKRINDPNVPDAIRAAATETLALRARDIPGDIRLLAGTLVPQNPAAVQIAAVNRLGEISNDAVPSLLLKDWKSHRPAVRDRIVAVLLRRHYWTRVLFSAVEERAVSAAEIDVVRWQEILDGSESSQRRRVKQILAGLVDPNRKKVVDRFQPAVTAHGDPARGKPLFVKHCATCHKLGDVGQNVGPELASRKDKSSESLVVAVLDPNRSVESKYVAYVAVTTDGRTYTGILADESATGLVLVGSKGERVELLRSQIEELTSTSKSLMPEGLEKELSPQDLADIIAYVQRFDTATTRP